MFGPVFFVLLTIGVVFAIVHAVRGSRVAEQEAKEEAARLEAMSPKDRADNLINQRILADMKRKADQERRQRFWDQANYGDLNPAMICPHCGVKGKIRTKAVDQKKGISGGKATAALLTGGVSLLATGLSRKETATQAHCGNCTNVWAF